MDKAELINKTLELSKRFGQSQMHFAFEPWRKLDVPLAQLKSLFLIHIRGSLTVNALASSLGVTPGNVTSIVDRLVSQGLLKRTEDPEDRRLVLLELTDKGRTTVMDIHDTNRGHIKSLFEKMSMEDLEALYRGISALLAITEEENKKMTAAQDKTGGCPFHAPFPPGTAGKIPANPLR